MKYIKYFNILLGISLCLAFTSCDDLLNVNPKVEVTASMIYNKPSDFANATNQLYQYLPAIMNFVGTSDDAQIARNRDGVMQRDLDADLVSNFTASTKISSSNIGPDDDYNRYLYQNYYKRVRSSNFILEKAADYSNQEEIKQYIGECYFFRAFYSYIFYRDFGPGVILRNTLNEESRELAIPRAERLEFFDWMIEDLKTSLAYFTKTEELTTENIGRITIEAAKALIARLYLFEGSWQRYHYNTTAMEDGKSFFQLAADYAKEVIDSGQFELFRNEAMGDESYRWMFILESSEQCNPFKINKSANKEYILRNRFDENVRQSGDNISHTAQDYYATRKMMEMYLDIDGLPIDKSEKFDGFDNFDSFRENRDPRLVYSLGYVGQQVWSYETNGRVNWTGDNADMATQAFVQGAKKGYRNLKWVTERAMSARADGFDVPIIRLAEMYLTYAEAIFEANGNITDDQLNYSLNKVRQRVSMPRLTNSFVQQHGLDMKTEIRRERTVEFYLEGMRLDDLRRWAIAEEEMSGNIEGFPYIYKGKSTVYASGGSSGITFQLQDADGNVYLNDRGRPAVTYTYKKTTETEAAYADGSSYVVFETGENRTFRIHNYYRPIPREEYDMNPYLEPNPGWSK